MNRLEPIARHWRGSLLQQGWRLWLTELRVCVPAWLALREPVDAFFEAVMINAEDAGVRKNRYAMLARLRGLFVNIADISTLS